MRARALPPLRLDLRCGATLAVALAAELTGMLAAHPAFAQEPATVPAVLAAELVDAGQTLRGSEAPAVVVGRLPDGFPAVPLSAGARVLGGALWRSGVAVALVQAQGSPEDARARELAALEGAGWKAPPPPPDFQDPAYPHFRSSSPPDPERDATRCAPGDSAGAVVVGARARDGRAIVRLLALPASRAVRCRLPQSLPRGFAQRWVRPVVPVLPPPAGVRVQPEGSSESGQYYVTTSARAFPDSATGALPAAVTLLAHYARALAAGGWTAVLVPGWDTTRATPLFVSPPDSTGARWIASVDVRPDSGDLLADGRRIRVVPATVTRPDSARGSAREPARTAPPALALRLRVAQVGVGAPGSWRAGSVSGVAYMSSVISTRAVTRDTTLPRTRPAGPPVARELVEALLGSSPFLADEHASERLTDGRPPAGWRAPVPAMPGARVLGGWRTGVGDEESISWLMLVATAPGSPADVAAAYGRQLDAAGWRSPPASRFDTAAASGFLSSTPRGRASRPGLATVARCAPNGDGYLTGSVDDRTTGSGSLFRLMLLRGTAGAGCAGEERGRHPELRAPVPPLTAPAGLVVEQGPSGGGGFEWRMTATVRGSATSAAAIVAAYAPQLRAAGWTVDSAAASPIVAAAPLRRTIAAATDSSAGASGGTDSPAAALLAGPQEWSGLLTATRRPDGAYTVAFDVRRDLGRGRSAR